jgi:predicted PurR-regulated permease PerM
MRAKLPVPNDITHTTLAVLSIGALIVASFWVLSPFLFSIIWAGLIVIATWPSEKNRGKVCNEADLPWH